MTPWDDGLAKLAKVYDEESKLRKYIWNEAIEAAAKMVEDSDVMMDGRFDLIEQIRKMKK